MSSDWDGDGAGTVGIYRSSDRRFYLRNTNSLGAADIVVPAGNAGWVGLAGWFGTPEPGTSIDEIPRTLEAEPRSAWTQRAARSTLMEKHTIEVLTVHHSEDAQSPSSGPARFRSWQSWHMDGHGWGDLAYHFIVGKDGKSLAQMNAGN